jgi:UDP-glucose 4,6-dehydratase
MDYIPKNILITGGLGFIASNFLEFLLKSYDNINIVNIDKISYCSNIDMNDVFNSYKNYKFIKSDISNLDLIFNILNDYKIDTILHFAAETHVDNSFGNSLTFTYTNVLGTHTLLECCKQFLLKYPDSIKRFIHVSTDEVYGHIDYTDDGANENFLLNPTNPYAATKASAEFIVRSYEHSFKFPSIIVRCNNIYGKNQFPEKIIPKFITNLTKKKNLEIQGDGNNVRSYLHISDFCAAFDTIMKKGIIGNIYNIGTNIETKNIDIARKIIDKFKNIYPQDDFYNYNIIKYVEDRPFNDKRYFINYDKLLSLGWDGPKIDIERGLEDVIFCYLNK